MSMTILQSWTIHWTAQDIVDLYCINVSPVCIFEAKRVGGQGPRCCECVSLIVTVSESESLSQRPRKISQSNRAVTLSCQHSPVQQPPPRVKCLG